MTNYQSIKVEKLKLNPKNPRIIKNDKFNKLVKSIKDFPEMLEARPIVVDENLIVLGGNMRLKAVKELGFVEVPTIILPGLTQEQKDEFLIKDNSNFGDWDWDILQHEWNVEDLGNWGLDINIFDVQFSEDEIEEETFNSDDIEEKTIGQKNLVNISLTVNKDDYKAGIDAEIELLIQKYPKTICKVQSVN